MNSDYNFSLNQEHFHLCYPQQIAQIFADFKHVLDIQKTKCHFLLDRDATVSTGQKVTKKSSQKYRRPPHGKPRFLRSSHQNVSTFLKFFTVGVPALKPCFLISPLPGSLIFGLLAHRFKMKFCLEKYPNCTISWPQTIWWVHGGERALAHKIKQSQTAVGCVEAIFASRVAIKIASLTQIDFNQMVCSLDLLVSFGSSQKYA